MNNAILQLFREIYTIPSYTWYICIYRNIYHISVHPFIARHTRKVIRKHEFVRNAFRIHRLFRVEQEIKPSKTDAIVVNIHWNDRLGGAHPSLLLYKMATAGWIERQDIVRSEWNIKCPARGHLLPSLIWSYEDCVAQSLQFEVCVYFSLKNQLLLYYTGHILKSFYWYRMWIQYIITHNLWQMSHANRPSTVPIRLLWNT